MCTATPCSASGQGTGKILRRGFLCLPRRRPYPHPAPAAAFPVAQEEINTLIIPILKVHFQTLNETWKTSAWFPPSLVAQDQISARGHSRPVQGQADPTPLCQDSGIPGWSSSRANPGDSCSEEIWFFYIQSPAGFRGVLYQFVYLIFIISLSWALAALPILMKSNWRLSRLLFKLCFCP